MIYGTRYLAHFCAPSCIYHFFGLTFRTIGSQQEFKNHLPVILPMHSNVTRKMSVSFTLAGPLSIPLHIAWHQSTESQKCTWRR